jgi:hypothetical protein
MDSFTILLRNLEVEVLENLQKIFKKISEHHGLLGWHG